MEIIYNLIQNAVKFNKSGGSILITLRFDYDSEMLLTSIEDTGIGIKEKIKRNLFIAFRGSNNNRVSKSGIGIGLSNSKCLTRALDG